MGGATTLAELSARLLQARYDVRNLSTVELMRWDYKQARRGARMPLGIAAICETLDDLLARSSGAAGLQAAMVEAAARRGGLGVLFALFSNLL